MPGSGKTELARMLGHKGFKVFEMGALAREKTAEAGLVPDEKNVGSYATRHRMELGRDIFARESIPLIKKLDGKKLAISGARSKIEIDYFKKNLPGLITIALTAPAELRFKRLSNRGRKDDAQAYDDFLMRDERERSYGLESAIDDADYLILNNTSNIEDLDHEVNQLLKVIEDGERKKRRE